MSTMNAEKFGKICDDVWRDRVAVLSRGGLLSNEAALVRAMYWRICKAGGEPGRSVGDNTAFLDKLVRQYRDQEGE
jgi:hypothetical protein